MVAWKQLFSRDSLHASVVNAIRHFRLSLKECETRARATQKQIESRLTRDLFAFRLSFLVKNQQNARARTFFFGKVCKCAFFFVSLQACRNMSFQMEQSNYTSLMEKRVRRILLVCNNYDSFALEED
jgi:hypothetical protein